MDFRQLIAGIIGMKMLHKLIRIDKIDRFILQRNFDPSCTQKFEVGGSDIKIDQCIGYIEEPLCPLYLSRCSESERCVPTADFKEDTVRR